MKPRRSRPDAGFTLIELVVVTAILVVLAGAALPVAGKAWTSAARRATRTRLEETARAALEFARDTGQPPHAVLDLCVRPDDVAGWIGPYVATMTTTRADAGHAQPAVHDAWSRPIEVEDASDDASHAAPHRAWEGARFRLVSRGPDGVPSADDLSVTVDLTPLRREKTLRILDVANGALAAWDALHPGEPLERDWPRARAHLVQAGLLPGGSEFERDAWGRTLVPDPEVDARAAAPAWRLVSAELLERSRGAR